ncbi:MAG: 3-hydroxyacyl-CoA dehydrogenase NAD-binding domain-containing protein [Desulfobacterales bacterium]|nr:3-hydroxyacyl-CoA dehydrogenase NAD-binding domain-containing protein [Desulfobacterales bacterium]
MAIKKVLVVGLGLMGRGILQVCAQAGFETYGYDVSKEAGEKAMGYIGTSLAGRVAKGKITEEAKTNTLKNIQIVSDLQAAANVDLAIEAVFENIKVKQDVFRTLDAALQPDAIIASNTSALPATPLASVTKRPDKFIIIHFHQPPTVMRLIEVVRAIQTSDETAAAAMDFCKAIDKDPVEIKVDCPGFLTNRTMVPLLNEVICCIYEGVATKEDIDLAYKSGFNWPMGPVQLCDFIGLDTLLHIMEDLHHRRGGDKFIPCPLLSNMVAAGYLGHKSGKGFYDYSKK